MYRSTYSRKTSTNTSGTTNDYQVRALAAQRTNYRAHIVGGLRSFHESDARFDRSDAGIQLSRLGRTGYRPCRTVVEDHDGSVPRMKHHIPKAVFQGSDLLSKNVVVYAEFFL